MKVAGTFARSRIKHIHFIGIGGSGMSGIAEVLLTLDYAVSGSDIQEGANTHRLAELGANIFIGHASDNISDCNVVVVSSAIDDSNPEIIRARELHIPIVPRAVMLAELMRFSNGIAIAGTHGKTTTTSLVTSMLADAGLDPTFVIGGKLNSTASNSRLGKGDYLVAEADESDASFLYLQPVISVITNIDSDHLDTYGGDFAKLKSTFVDFLHHLPFYGLAVLCFDDPDVRDILDDIGRPIITYGTQEGADVQATRVRYSEGRSYFTVVRAGKQDLEINLSMPGEHNIQNALAAIVIATELGIEDSSIADTLNSFSGVGRRFQRYGDINTPNGQVTLVDDYGHHPTEMAATLHAVRNAWPDRRMVVLFQPHRYTRTRDLFEDFAKVLSSPDVLLLLDVYAASEEPIAGADGRSLARAIRNRGEVEPIFIDNKEDVAGMLMHHLQDGDVLLTLGAGDIGTIATKLPTQLTAGGVS